MCAAIQNQPRPKQESTERPPQPSSSPIISTSPATGRKLGEVAVTPVEQIPIMLERAKAAQKAWYEQGLKARVAILRKLVYLLYRDMDTIIDMLVAEQGRPRFEAYLEFWASIELVAFYARNARKVLAPEPIFVVYLPHRQHWVEHHPYGAVAVISPWNFPIMLSLPSLVAALVTGNTVLYKPSEFSTQVGEILVNLIHEAGVPDSVLQIVHGLGEVGAALVTAGPDKIVFTGSSATARKIASAAAEKLTPLTLELGGKDAAIVLEDTDLDRTAVALAWGGIFNAGQACLSVERIYARREIADQLVQKMAAVINDHVRVGAGETDPISALGPITTPAQMTIVDSHVKDAIAQGAKVVTGGRPAETGNGDRTGDPVGRYYLPTILTNVTPDMRIVKDETFGPVIVVIPVDSDEQAIQLANDTPFGLTGSVWSRSRNRAIAIAQQLRVGHASINDHIMSASTPNVPWGGVGDSGYGRTRGREGLLDMTYLQAISIERFAPLPREFFWYPYTPLKLSLIRRGLTLLYAPTWREKFRALFSRQL